MNINTYADKIERMTLVNGGIVLSFSSYDPTENTFRNVLTIKLSLQNFLSSFRVMQEFHERLTNGGANSVPAAVEAGSTPDNQQEPAEKPVEKPRTRRAKRRKTATSEKA